MRKFVFVLVAVFVVLSGGCASMEKANKQRQVASVLSYLYPGSEQVPPAPDKVAELRVPFRIGVAFVPDSIEPEFRLPENERITLANKVRDAFIDYPFVSDIIAVPSVYLERGGSFANLDRIAALLKIDVIALISFDQVQNAGATEWSFLYWTGLGAYVVEGDKYDILTAVETAVFDIRSRRLLMRGGGISTTKGSATMVGFAEKAREARTRGIEAAMKDMTRNLQSAVETFREEAPKDPNIKLILPPGYDPNATRRTAR